MAGLLLTLLLLFTPGLTVGDMATKKVVCYIGTWSAHRNGHGNFQLEYVKPQLCTHIIYSFVGITPAGEVKVLDEELDLSSSKTGYAQFNALKSKNTKTMLAIGGWNEGSTNYSIVVNNATLRATFVQNVVIFLQKYNFDGFDLDWEYPAQRGGASSDLEAFVDLVKELRTAFDKHNFILSAAVGVARYLVGSAYDVRQLSEYLDFINMMTYDLHGSWDGKTGHNSPLYASSAYTNEAEQLLNVNASVHYWIENGADPSKLILGLPAYGRTFTLANVYNTGIGVPSNGPGDSGPYTQEAGILAYNEICKKIQEKGWTIMWNDEQKVPYAVNGSQWIGYDDETSITLKAQFIRDMGLGGAMVWSMDMDDFRGLCGDTPYPLLTRINEILREVTVD